MIFIPYQKIHNLLKYLYFTENFVLYQKIRLVEKFIHQMNRCSMIFLGSTNLFVKYENFVLYQKNHTSLKYSYLTENFEHLMCK